MSLITTKEANQANKARRALTAITHLIEDKIIPSDQFSQNNLLDGYRAMRIWLFDRPDTETTAMWWIAVGTQEQLDQGLAHSTEFRTSRPAIALALDARIEALELVAAAIDPFIGLTGD